MVALPTAASLTAFLDWPADDAARIDPHLLTVTAFVRSYVRDVGFDATGCEPDLAAVITTATARSVANPTHVVREEAGNWSAVPARFEGFTLVEQAVLHRYRRRAA